MLIDFNEIQEIKIPCMNDGTGMMTVKMYNDENYRIIPTRIHKGGSIGTHTQNSGDDLNYIISGKGTRATLSAQNAEVSISAKSSCLTVSRGQRISDL